MRSRIQATKSISLARTNTRDYKVPNTHCPLGFGPHFGLLLLPSSSSKRNNSFTISHRPASYSTPLITLKKRTRTIRKRIPQNHSLSTLSFKIALRRAHTRILNPTSYYRTIASPLCPLLNYSSTSTTELERVRPTLSSHTLRQYHKLQGLTAMATAAAGTVTMDNYQFPTQRLKARMSDGSRTPLVLIACGSFSPITFLHLRMFEMAAGMLSS